MNTTTTTTTTTRPALLIRWTVSGLLHDGMGWSENTPYRSGTLTIGHDASDALVSRRIRAAAGINGKHWRVDSWCGADCGVWRNGSVGCYADVIATNDHPDALG